MEFVIDQGELYVIYAIILSNEALGTINVAILVEWLYDPISPPLSLSLSLSLSHTLSHIFLFSHIP